MTYVIWPMTSDLWPQGLGFKGIPNISSATKSQWLKSNRNQMLQRRGILQKLRRSWQKGCKHSNFTIDKPCKFRMAYIRGVWLNEIWPQRLGFKRLLRISCASKFQWLKSNKDWRKESYRNCKGGGRRAASAANSPLTTHANRYSTTEPPFGPLLLVTGAHMLNPEQALYLPNYPHSLAGPSHQLQPPCFQVFVSLRRRYMVRRHSNSPASTTIGQPKNGTRKCGDGYHPATNPIMAISSTTIHIRFDYCPSTFHV